MSATSNDPNYELLAKFRTDGLTPRGPNGSALPEGNGIFELTPASVSPTRVIGRDRLGNDVEETVNAHYSRPFLTKEGAINSVPMRTGAIFSMAAEAIAYEVETTRDLLAAGWIPLNTCPYTTGFGSITGTKHLIDNPDRIEDCGGAPNGCVHLKELQQERLAANAERWRLEEESFKAKMNQGAAQKLLGDLLQAQTMIAEVAKTPAVEQPKSPSQRMKER